MQTMILLQYLFSNKFLCERECYLLILYIMLCIDIKSRNHAPFVPFFSFGEYTYKLAIIGPTKTLSN